MSMKEIVRQNPILAILRNIPLEKTVDYVQAIVDGGVCFFEVALNSPRALDQIALLRRTFDSRVLVGAGTAVTVEKAKSALDAGAQFLLAPSAPAAVLAYCQSHQIDFLPGVFTPTDVQLCLDHGFSTLKLFPAGDLPLSYVKNLKGPYPETDYVAIGGVSPDNAAHFLRAGCVGVGMASALLPAQSWQSNDWESCTKAVRALCDSLAPDR